jgi:uncharacterized membrane protein
VANNHFAAAPVAVYGGVLIMCSLAFLLLSYILASHSGKNSELAQALGKDWKGKASLAIYIVAVMVAFISPLLSCALYVVVACVWFIPDKRMERKVMHREE